MISEKMYAVHRAQNYTMAERTKYRQKLYMEQANRHREIISRNCYAIKKEGQDVSSNTDGKSD